MSPIYVVTLICTFNHVVFVGTRFTMLLYALHLGASPAAVGVLGALFSVLSAVTLVSVGRWADRVGTRRPMLGLNLAITACLATLFFWPSLTALFVAATVIGWLYNAFWVCGQQLIGHMSTPENRASNYGVATTGLALSSFGGPVLAGFAIDHLGHAPTLGALAALAVVPALMLAGTRMRFPPPRHPRHASGTSAGAGAAQRGIFDLLRHRALRRILVVTLALGATWDLFNFLMPIRGTELRFSASVTGLVFGAFTAGVFVVRLFVPVLLRRLSQWRLLMCSLAVAALCHVLFVPAGSFVPLVAVAFVLGLALGVQLPVSSALLYENAPPERGGEAIGLRVMLSSINGTLLPLVAGALSNLGGVRPIFLLVAVLLSGVLYANRAQWARAAHAGAGSAGTISS
jgi:MFS family permease